MKKTEKVLNFALPLITVGIIIALWAAAASAADNEYVLPTVSATFKKAFELFKSAKFYSAFFSTLIRCVVAFLLSYALAFAAAYFSYKSKYAERALSPFIAIVRTLPTIAVVLLLTVWVNSKVAPVIVTMLVVFPTLFDNLYSALCGIDKDIGEMCKVFGVKKKDRLFKVVIPEIAPEFIRAAGAGLSLNIKLMVAAEVLSQTANSMGYLLNTAKIYFEISTMIALVLFTVAVGLIVESVFRFLSKKAAKV
ncbi:MAG: ABC transporter permease subunit [Clostridia bacterium]|nr:ABC transporter permease subunit [Clostridia bacterium]